jgi:5-(carboxyamino)imidazole ribonucleotide synthase
MTVINPGSGGWIGVLGGGQLGRMMALEARRMGFSVLKWTGGDKSGAAFLADRVIEDPFDSKSALETFVESVDLATVEFENIPRELLHEVDRQLPLMPGPRAVEICQHREREKNFLAENGIPCAKFHVVDSADSLVVAMADQAGDVILKTAEFGYDGKGQQMIARSELGEDLAAACREIWNEFDTPRAVVEEKIDLAQELSVLVARGQTGEVVTYDPAENEHRNHILDVSILPARAPDELLAQARELAVEVATALDYVGILAVEFFVAGDGRLLVNEMAPRAHNSGHHTLDACESSQFEQQVRAICGLPFGSPELICPAVMWNLLGDLWIDETTPPDWSPVLKTPGAKLHLYGKSHARAGRKMGHVTFTAKTPQQALDRASRCREAFGYDAIK